MEDFFYRELLKYLKLAEEKRRWNLFTDIPWEQANAGTSETLAQCVETFCAVEMYLPDFTAKLLQMIRKSRGRAWFHINWGYEESKHSMTLEGWLVASGHRTEEQRELFQKELLGQEWELPFDHPRQMFCYTMIQELATFWNYRNLEKIAAKERDVCLVAALRVISVDERVHYNFFRNMVKEWMKWDERGTVEDLKYVFDNFVMPGRTQIPSYDEAARILAQTGIYGPREYIKLVKNPILEDLSLDKDFNQMEDGQKAGEEAKAEKAALENGVPRIELANGHAVPVNGHGPLNSHALTQVLSNTRPRKDKWDSRHAIPTYENGRKRSPLLDAFGVEPKVRTEPSRSIILDTDSVMTRGSRGMDKLDNATDQNLMAHGDELSNNAEELRAEREKNRLEREITRKSRVKNQRLFRTENDQ
jgi:acyl-[acyl-carrier-protein] desaturase